MAESIFPPGVVISGLIGITALLLPLWIEKMDPAGTKTKHQQTPVSTYA